MTCSPYLIDVTILEGTDGLWCHVVESATADIPLHTGVIQLNLLRYTKVYQAQANSSAHKVLRLQIIVDYAFIMNNLQAVSKGSYLVKGHTMRSHAI